MINQVGTPYSTSTQAADTQRAATQSAAADIMTVNAGSQTKQEVVFSSLAQQLSDSANRTDAEYAGLSRKELGEKATTLLKKITGPDYDANRAINNAEVPDSSDPERLGRAADATKFVNGSGKNPFAGLSRDQLALITYDDSGLYTTNERRAAWEESYDQEYAWRQEVVAKAMAEYNSSGKLTGFFSEVRDHYKTLPAIEQSQYPENDEAKLQKWIDLDYNYFTNTVEGKGSPDDILSLQESLNILQQ
ncbi:hypothetical protein [Pectobacterium aroidearum]|uniref:hypothetical protein n=1 Tax=Pectobacterium aroidearum TaxID=1201031 RepID=UPI0015E01095|nr:hypothetical protein [Pectobacterium aroidearum]MBA0204885.1 hypothetical protein [Pectobacterium aroidearum]